MPRAGGSCRTHRSRAADPGAGDGTIVGLAVQPSADLVPALLGILVTGAAYVPLDSADPQSRTAAVLADADPVAVLADAAEAARLPEGTPIWLVADIETAAATTARPANTNTASTSTTTTTTTTTTYQPSTIATTTAHHPTPESPAYIIYTSGSTGRPKGVVVPHRAIVARIRALREIYPLFTSDRILHKAHIAFDVSLTEIFRPLSEGATVVLARPGGRRDPSYLARTIADRGVTIADFVPALLEAFLAEPAAAECHALRQIHCGGEPMPPSIPARVAAVLGDCPVHNLYGPTETAVEVTHWLCDPLNIGRVPVGRPVPNTAVYVLDDDLLPAAPGQTGEVYIAGVQLAHGYLNRPGLTAERFVADPHGAPGARMYRTGDVGRWRPDGVLELSGRADDQLKVRGHRIEAGEVEAVLESVPGVRRAVVAACPDGTGTRRLVAYLVGGPEPAVVRRRVAERLPEHMVPTAVVALDELPVFPNGKVDRAALPVPEAFGPERGRAASGPEEEAMCRMFGEVLGISEVGAEQSFFDLGGHSLLAARLISKVRTVFGVELPIDTVFDTPTASGLAARLGDADRARPVLRRHPSRQEASR
ncbi:amino acid adenylation domain-containing protein [Catenulispora yoronensis]